MEGNAVWLERLIAALEKRARWLGMTVIPRMKEEIAGYEMLFDSVVGLLIRKGLLREDPYKYDQVFTDIVVPEDQPLPEFESSDELSYRLAAFRRQLKLLTAEYPLDLASLNLGRLKKLSALLFYVNWLEFGEGSPSPTTRGFARSFMKVRMGSDSIASQVLKDAEMQILKKLQDLREMLAALISFQRESWKADVRRGVLSRITPPEGDAKREELLRALRRTFAQTMPSRSWYNALAEEIADEELGPDGPARKERILAQLVVTETEARSSGEAAAPERGGGRETLLEAIRILARPHEDVTLALTVLEENEKLFTEDKRPGGWLSRLFRRRRQRRPVERVYKVQYTEPGAPDSKIETVDFPAFLLEATKKASLLGVLASGSGPAYRRLAATGDEQLAAFVDRQLHDLLLIHRRMEGLNTVFQARAVQEKRTARGIKVELLTIKNGIVKANQRRHEYRGGG